MTHAVNLLIIYQAKATVKVKMLGYTECEVCRLTFNDDEFENYLTTWKWEWMEDYNPEICPDCFEKAKAKEEENAQKEAELVALREENETLRVKLAAASTTSAQPQEGGAEAWVEK
jgi:hypothetical protein